MPRPYRPAPIALLCLACLLPGCAAEAQEGYVESVTGPTGEVISFEMVPLPGGTFVMGSDSGEAGHQPDESVEVVFHRHMADVVPVHDTGHDVHQFVLIDREQVGGHQLADSRVELARFARLPECRRLPGMNRSAGTLPIDRCRNESCQGLGPIGLGFGVCIGIDEPLRSGAKTVNPLLNDTQIAVHIG